MCEKQTRTRRTCLAIRDIIVSVYTARMMVPCRLEKVRHLAARQGRIHQTKDNEAWCCNEACTGVAIRRARVLQ